MFITNKATALLCTCCSSRLASFRGCGAQAGLPLLHVLNSTLRELNSAGSHRLLHSTHRGTADASETHGGSVQKRRLARWVQWLNIHYQGIVSVSCYNRQLRASSQRQRHRVSIQSLKKLVFALPLWGYVCEVIFVTSHILISIFVKGLDKYFTLFKLQLHSLSGVWEIRILVFSMN